MIQLNKHWVKVALSLLVVCMVGLLTGDFIAMMIAGLPCSFFAIAVFIIVLFVMLRGDAE